MVNLAIFEARIANGESVNRLLGELAESGDEQLVKLQQLVWQVGCSTSEVISALAEQQSFARELSDQAQVAAANAKLTAQITVALPWLTLLICNWSGVNPLGNLFSNPFGTMSLAIALALTWLANRNADRIISRHQVIPPDPGFDALLAAVALDNGINHRQLTRFLDAPKASSLELRKLARDLRAQERLTQQRGLAKLPQKLILNIGLLLLPATLLLTLTAIALQGFAGIASQ